MTELHDNPLLATEGLPAFDTITPAHVVPAVRQVLAESERQLSALEASLLEKLETEGGSADTTPSAGVTWDDVMLPLDEMDRPYEYAWGPVSHLFGVKNSPELREAYETVLGDVVTFSLRAKQSAPIYRALKSLRESDDWSSLSEARRRIIEAKLLSAELAGIGLPEAERKRFNEIAQELSRLSTDFSNHVLDATKAFSLTLTTAEEIDGLPPSLLQLAAQSHNEAQAAESTKEAGTDTEPVEATPENGPWRLTLEAPIVIPFLQHSRRRDLREKLHRAFISRASQGDLDNSPLIDTILKLRKEKAKLLGYQSYAQVSLTEKMAPDVAAVEEMFETLRSASMEPARSDLEDLRQLAVESGFSEPLLHWDIGFWAERLREKRFDFTDEQLRPYFPLPRVLDGLFALVERLFGIKVEAADGQAPVWQKDVRFFRIADADGTAIAAFFLDPYSRPADKRGGAWMDTCMTRRQLADGLQVPVAHLVCNGTPPTKARPSLMTFREVETLFHEFGHGLQHMLTTVNEPDAAGINNVEWDAVELPSQFMENWCYHKPTLTGMSGHYQTGEPLPDDLFQKLCAARTFRAGSMMLRQLQFGMTDIELHDKFDPDGSETVLEVQRRISEKTSLLPVLPEDRSLCSFQHIFAGGYAAGYYSYKWAEVLSADAFSAFEEAGLDNESAIAETGRRFRNTILSQGGSRHPMELFKEFRGREPNPEPLLRHAGLL